MSDEKLIKAIEFSGNQLLSKIHSVFNEENIQWYIARIDRGCGTYVYKSNFYWNNSLNIVIDIENIENYIEKNNISVDTAAKLLISHEMFHIILGHFSSKYESHNKRLLNIAGDIEINQIIGLEAPGLQPEDFGFKPYRDTDYYYEELLKLYADEEKNRDSGQFSNDQFDDDHDDDTQSNDTQSNTTQSSNENSNDSFDNNIIDELIPEDRIVNEVTAEKLSETTINITSKPGTLAELEARIKKQLNAKDTYNIQGLQEVINKIERKEKTQRISPHGKKDTYYKFNNRRKNGSLILPGKKLTDSGVKKKYDTSFTAFIDISGSTSGTCHKDLMNVAKKLHSIGGTIVYYNGKLQSICETEDCFFPERAYGGTSISRAISEYLETHSLNRAYVFTDGNDYFENLKSVCEKYTVYYVNYRKVTELLSDTHPTPNWR